MESNRKTASLVGALYILGTLAGILSVAFTSSFLSAPDYLKQIPANANQIILGALSVLVMGFALALVPVYLFPIFKKQDEALALGYVVLRGGVETVTYILTAISFLLLLPAGLLFILCMLGVGLLISTVSNTQQEAMLTSFLVIMPVMLLSGFMFPVSSMPVPFQWLTLLNPLRHFLEIVRAIFLKGAGLDALWPQYLALLLMSAGLLRLATTRFHKTVR